MSIHSGFRASFSSSLDRRPWPPIPNGGLNVRAEPWDTTLMRFSPVPLPSKSGYENEDLAKAWRLASLLWKVGNFASPTPSTPQTRTCTYCSRNPRGCSSQRVLQHPGLEGRGPSAKLYVNWHPVQEPSGPPPAQCLNYADWKEK